MRFIFIDSTFDVQIPILITNSVDVTSSPLPLRNWGWGSLFFLSLICRSLPLRSGVPARRMGGAALGPRPRRLALAGAAGARGGRPRLLSPRRSGIQELCKPQSVVRCRASPAAAARRDETMYSLRQPRWQGESRRCSRRRDVARALCSASRFGANPPRC